MSPVVALLGPQRRKPVVRRVIGELGLSGPIATITAGWEEREAEDDELKEHVGDEAINLRLHQRSEELVKQDPELHEALTERHVRLLALQDLYRLRLDHALTAARELHALEADEGLINAERLDSLAAVAALDAHHLERVRAIDAEFIARWSPWSRDALVGIRQEIVEELEQCEAVAIAGGHVQVLLNRLRLFKLGPLLRDKPIIAWSAGAMCLTERIVLFHDHPPQGRGNPECLEPGLGLCPGVVVLPHARLRLRLSDPVRVALLARRFSPHVCLALDDESIAWWDGTTWRAEPQTRTLLQSGQVAEGLPA